jgi:hypothetical protein
MRAQLTSEALTQPLINGLIVKLISLFLKIISKRGTLRVATSYENENCRNTFQNGDWLKSQNNGDFL